MKFINPWRKMLKDNPYCNFEYFEFYESQRIYQDGDYQIFKKCKDDHVHTYKGTAITERVKPCKELINNLKNGLNTDDYHMYIRPMEIINLYEKCELLPPLN